MEQPIPSGLIKSTLHHLLLEVEKARLMYQLADQKLQSEARLMFATHSLNGSEWHVDVPNGTMTKIPKSEPPPTPDASPVDPPG